jgi:hypothetical protein
MSIDKKLEKLARILPGVKGYQDKDAARDTDKQLRLRLAAELERIARALEQDKQREVDANELGLLPALERISGKLNRLGNTIQYAARGYRGFFDRRRPDRSALEQLCQFDLGLLAEIETLDVALARLRDAHGDDLRVRARLTELDQAVERLESTFAQRATMLMAG